MIYIEQLNKKFGSLQALKSVDLNLAPGRITAVLGPNGAGKTTLIKSVLGLVKPDSGIITVDGTRVNGNSDYRRKIGYMPQLARYPENLTVTEILEMIRDIRGAEAGPAVPSSHSSGSDAGDTSDITDASDAEAPPAAGKEVSPAAGKEVSPAAGKEVSPAAGKEVSPAAGKEVSPTAGKEVFPEQPGGAGLDFELWERFGLNTEKDKPFRTLSGGNRQKVSAVLAFMFRPSVLFLDEPSAGLDPVSSSILKDKILSERDRGTTIILTSHIMSEVQELAEQVVYLLEGELHFEMSMKELLAETDQSTLERAIAQKLNDSESTNNAGNSAQSNDSARSSDSAGSTNNAGNSAQSNDSAGNTNGAGKHNGRRPHTHKEQTEI